MFGLLIGFACLYNFLEYTGIGIALLAYLNLGIYTVKKTYEVNELKLKLLRRWYYSWFGFSDGIDLEKIDPKLTMDYLDKQYKNSKNVEDFINKCIISEPGVVTFYF